LVNGRCGDPTVYVETLFEKRSLLFDIGEIASLSPRKIRRIDQVLVSHAHIDQFVGFDHMLRLLVGQEKSVEIFGPSGFTERVCHKLQAYRWKLVENYPSDLVFVVSELGSTNSISGTKFRLRTAFAAEPKERDICRPGFGNRCAFAETSSAAWYRPSACASLQRRDL
jgi:ribonuclease Z